MYAPGAQLVSIFPNKLSHTPNPAAAAAIFGATRPSRDEVAAFLFANPRKALRGVRDKIRQLESRRGRRGSLAYLNTDDLLGTVIVRIDRAMLTGVLRTDHEGKFWAYVHTTGENAVLELLRNDKAGRFRDLDTRELRIAPLLLDAAAETAARMTALLAIASTDADRRLLCFKARGFSYALIAAATGRSQPALRKQWSKLRTRLRLRSPAGERLHP